MTFILLWICCWPKASWEWLILLTRCCLGSQVWLLMSQGSWKCNPMPHMLMLRADRAGLQGQAVQRTQRDSQAGAVTVYDLIFEAIHYATSDTFIYLGSHKGHSNLWTSHLVGGMANSKQCLSRGTVSLNISYSVGWWQGWTWSPSLHDSTSWPWHWTLEFYDLENSSMPLV